MLRKISLYSKILLPALLFTVVSAMESSDCVSTSDEYNSNLYTKLVFEDGVTFEAHEIVKIAMSVMDEVESVDPIVPDYETYEEQIEAKFCELLDSFVEKASAYYEVPGDLLRFLLYHFDKLGMNVFVPLVRIDNFDFCEEGKKSIAIGNFLFNECQISIKLQNSLVPLDYASSVIQKVFEKQLNGEDVSSSLITQWLWEKLISKIKSKRDAQQEPIEFIQESFDKHILPETVQYVHHSFEGWLGLGIHLQNKESRPNIKAWWLCVGDRLIGLKNNPERWDLYVTDHGFNEDIVKGTDKSLVTFNRECGMLLSASVKFIKKYDSLDRVTKDIVLKRFLVLHALGLTGDHFRNEYLLHLLIFGYTADTFPKEKRILELMDIFSLGLYSIDPLTDKEQDVLAEMNRHETLVAEKYFDATCEYMRSRKQDIIDYLHPEKSVFYTQLDAIFPLEDAERYKKFFVLKEKSKKLGVGDPAHIFQPIHTFGSIYKGAAYPEFAETIERYFSSSGSLSSTELAKIMRDILRGEPIDDENLYFLPNLVAAWFVSEVGRNHLSLLSGLVLLDLIESDVVHRDSHGNNLYTWKHTLVHPSASRNQDKMMDMYGESVGVKNIDGIHPMSHKGSVNHCREDFMVNGEKLRPVRQKEGHLFIHWLSEKLGEHVSLSRDYLSEPKRGKKGKRGRPGTKEYDEINYLLGVEEVSTISSGKERLRKKWEKLQQIKGALLDRTSTLDLVLKK